MRWKIAEAKQELSRLVREAATEPQWIQNRDRVVAVVIDAVEGEAFLAWRRRARAESLADALDNVAAIARASSYTLLPIERVDRESAFAPPPARPLRRRRPRAR